MFIISNIKIMKHSLQLLTSLCMFALNKNQLDEQMYTYLTGNSDFTLKLLMAVNRQKLFVEIAITCQLSIGLSYMILSAYTSFRPVTSLLERGLRISRIF